MSVNKTKKKIFIIVIVIGLLLPILYVANNKYEQHQAYLEQLRIEEEARIAEEQEKERINNLAVSETIYLCINEPYQIDGKILEGNSISISSKNNIQYVVGVLNGESIFYSPSLDKKIKFSVSDLYEMPHIDNYKENIFLNAFTSEQAKYLDEVLKARIEKAGYKTRAGVAEAARFLSMMFKYKIPYFCENGRLTTNGCDGEGRYYHKGLYLDESKFDLLNPNGIINGPTPWGGLMHHSCGQLLKPNGLDCSGFVSWCFVQAGFDVGDYGAGNNSPGNAFCLIDLGNGDAGAIWLDKVDPNQIQSGDIIAWEGTVAIVVGVDDDNIYTAHQYWDNGLEVITDTKISLKDYPYGEDCGDWQYVSLMDDYYKTNGNGNGNYTPMWVQPLN